MSPSSAYPSAFSEQSHGERFFLRELREIGPLGDGKLGSFHVINEQPGAVPIDEMVWLLAERGAFIRLTTTGAAADYLATVFVDPIP